MLNLFKDKIKFVSDQPKIQNNKIILDEIENWFNNLIQYEKFSIPKQGGHNKQTGSALIKPSANPLKYKKFKTISDAYIQKETKSYLQGDKFNIRIVLGVTWRQDYSYDAGAYYREPFETMEVHHYKLGKIRVIKDCIYYQKEVPKPQFLFSFNFLESKKDKDVILNSKMKRHIDKRNGTTHVAVIDEIYDMAIFDRSRIVRNSISKDLYLDYEPIIYDIDKIKKLYNEFVQDCKTLLKKHAINFEDLF